MIEIYLVVVLVSLLLTLNPFPLRISLVNVGISLGQCRFVLGHLKIHQWKMKYDEET